MTDNLPEKTMIQIGREDWQPCRIYHNGFGQNHYIRFISDNQQVTIYGHYEDLKAVLSRLLVMVTPTNQDTSPTQEIDRVSTITPAEVIAYFRSSPVLAPMADDVETVLSPLVQIGQPSDWDIVKSQLDISTLVENGQPVRGAQQQIATALGVPNAGSYRKRVLAVLGQAINSTTTQKGPKTAKVA